MTQVNKEVTVDASKVYDTMRSLFRLLSFQKMHSPDILINQEKEIFCGRACKLSALEIRNFVDIWPRYLKEQTTQEEVNNYQAATEFEQHLLDLN